VVVVSAKGGMMLCCLWLRKCESWR